MSCRALNFGKLLQRPNWPGGMLDHVASTGLEVWQGFSSSDGTSVFCIFTLSRMFVAHACDVLWNYIWICINHRSKFFNKLRRHVSTVLWTWHETTVFLKPSRTLGWSIFAAQVGFCCDQQPGPDDNRCHCHPIIMILVSSCPKIVKHLATLCKSRFWELFAWAVPGLIRIYVLPIQPSLQSYDVICLCDFVKPSQTGRHLRGECPCLRRNFQKWGACIPAIPF